MATVIIRPNSTVQAGWPDPFGGVRPDVVNDDSDATGVTNSDGGGTFEDIYEMDDISGEAVDITTFTYFTRAVKGTGQNAIFSGGIQVGTGTKDYSDSHDIVQGTGAQQRSTVRSNDPDGDPWTPTKVNNVRALARVTFTTAGKVINFFDLWIIVVHTVGGGRFAMNVAQWLAPLAAAASHGLMRREVVAILRTMRTRPSSAEEFAALEAAFRVRPVFLIPAKG